MHFKYRNVNEAFRGLVTEFYEAGRRSPNIVRSTSRNGDVLYIQEPVTITYTHPRERVLFNPARDCNPFFHVYEALWMLAGRNDVAPLKYYVSTIDQFSDDGDIFNGAYGWRWRGSRYRQDGNLYWDQDQLKLIIEHLKAKPDSRRCVLQMWNVEDDLLKIDFSKDVCCNTCAYFSLRAVAKEDSQGQVLNDSSYFLDMTVCNRSNDLIWGLLGANAVHFSFLQEYMAACIGCEVGVYNQITNNCHVYLNDKWQPEKWLADDTPDWYFTNDGPTPPLPGVRMFPLVKDPVTFDLECVEFISINPLKDTDPQPSCSHWKEPFLANVAQPMCNAFMFHKMRIYEVALQWVEKVQSDDWRIAATKWLLKRKERYEARTNEA